MAFSSNESHFLLAKDSRTAYSGVRLDHATAPDGPAKCQAFKEDHVLRERVLVDSVWCVHPKDRIRGVFRSSLGETG